MSPTKAIVRTTAGAIVLSSLWWTTGQGQEVEEEEEAPIFNNEVEAGVGYSTTDSAKFGEYTGLNTDGPFGIGNFRFRHRSPYDSDETSYYELTGRNLGLDSRSVRGKFGEQGTYDVFLDYDEIPHFIFNDAVTPYLGAGGGNLTLPPNWEAAATTDGFGTLGTDLREVDIETKRKRFTGGVTWRLAPEWSIGAQFRHEDKEGKDTIGGAFGTNGGNPSTAILPEPIDYQTDIVDLNLQYAGKRSQVQLGYEFSAFKNKTDRLRFQNAYSTNGRGAPWAPETGYPTGFGEFALPPDNTAHHVAITGAYNLDETTRVTAHGAYGRLEQDEDFLPYSAIPALQASVTTPLPRDSAEAKINTWFADLGVSSRPMPKLDVSASYRFDRRDNQTPQDVFVRIRADAEDQPAGLDNGNARINLPYDYTKHVADVEAGYRVLPQTRASVGYEFEYVDREFQEVSETREHTISGRVSSSPFPFANGWLEYGHAIRNGSTYVDNEIFLQGHTEAFLQTLPPDQRFENHPAMRKFPLADRTRDFVNASLDLFPQDEVTVGLRAGYARADYDESELGLTKTSNLHATIDISYSPSDVLTSFAYVTYEQLERDQRGHSWNPFTAPSLTNPGQRWSVDSTDDVLTTGVGFNWQIIRNVLALTGDYTFSHADTRIEPQGGADLTFAPLPDIETTLHSVGARLGYTFAPAATLNLAYRFETLATHDFAVDNIEPDTIPFVLWIGEDSPNYSANVYGISVSLRF